MMMMTQAGLSLLMLLLTMMSLSQLQAAPIICGTDADGGASVKSSEETAATAATGEVAETAATPKPSEVNQFLHNVQCTLEKAKPWIEDIEKEAKRLEETAKRVGLSIVHRFGHLMDSLLGPAANRIPAVTTTTTTTTITPDPSAGTEPNLAMAVSVGADQVTPSTESPLANEADNDINDINNVEPLK